MTVKGASTRLDATLEHHWCNCVLGLVEGHGETIAVAFRFEDAPMRDVDTNGTHGHSNGDRRRVLSISETAVLLGISRAHAYELVARNALAHVRLGRRIVIPKRAIDELLSDEPA
jgi:excisionase family DNA binding protein